MHRYIESNSSLEGMRIACGREGIDAFSKILGLNSINYKITAMGWIGNKIVIDILNEQNKEEITLCIARRIETQPALLKTHYLDIYYNGQKSDELFISHIQSLDLSDYSLEDLLEIIKKDSEAGSAKLPLPKSERSDKPDNHLDSWGGNQLYANFLAEGEFARGQLDSVNIYENCVFIQHSDIECVSLKPNIDIRLIFFLVKYPWLSRNKERYKGLVRNELPDMDKFFSTDLRERDIILGHNKLKEVIDYALENVKGKNIFLSNTCTPVVIGEDVESVVRKARERRRDFLYLTVTPQSMEVVLKDLFNRPKKNRLKKQGKVINLIGFENENYLKSLVKFLGILGIEVNSIAIPDVSGKTLDRYMRGGVDIIKPNSLWQHLFDQLCSASSHKYISLDAPYGFEGTIKWILELGRILGMKLNRSDILKKIEEKIRDEYYRLKGQMKDIGVLFVLRKDEAGYLVDSAKSWGIPLLDFLIEMGVNIEIFIKADSLEEARSSANPLLKRLGKYGSFEIRYFDSFERMMSLVERSRGQLIFSNHTDDWRASSASKGCFSLTDFEIGFGGAIYTMKRLIHLSQNRFFGKFGRYLKRDRYGRLIKDE